jgi:hypothetical protein
MEASPEVFYAAAGPLKGSRRSMRKLFTCLGAIVQLLFFSVAATAQSVDRPALENEIRGLVTELKQTEQRYLAPSEKDQRKYADFLLQTDTGLTRLLPRETYDGKLSIQGGGAYFSFARLTHEYGFGSDIELQQNQLSVGFAGADFGFLTRLGKVPLDTITLDHPGVVFPASFQAPLDEPSARAEGRRASNGFQENGFLYKSRLPVKKKNTYILRSIGYRESDLLIAFTVVRQDSDGSVVLLWKILKRFPVPDLVSAQTSAIKK